MSNFKNILKKELKELFRDKKSLAMMLVIPIMIPLLIIGLSAVFNMEMNKSVEEYNKIGFSYELTETEKSIASDLEIEAVTKETSELEKDYKNGVIDLYVTKEDNNYVINGDNNDNTTYALYLTNKFFEIYKEYLQREYLTNKKINGDEVINIINVSENIKEADNFFASYITTYGFLFIIMAITVSATYPATDTTAGEKERGTLETLLTFPIKAKEIIVGKFLCVTLSSIITGLLSLVFLMISLNIAGNSFKIYEGMSLMLSFNSIIYSIIVIIAYSFLISGLCIAIASKSKTFKEAQSALTPLTFISFFPGMVAFMVNIKSSALLSMVPFLNFTLLFEDITNNNTSALNLILMIVSTIVIIGVVLAIIIRQYKSEKVLFNI